MNRKTTQLRPMTLLCAGFVALFSQVSVAVQTEGFHISVGIVLLQVLLFAYPELPVLPLTGYSAVGVFLLRLGNAALTGKPAAETISEYAPEMLFYLCFGVLFWLAFQKRRTGAYRFSYAPALAAMDALANLTELLVREGIGAFSGALLLQIAVIAFIRAAAAGCVLFALRRYGVRILRKEDSARYQKLLFMTADLRSEVVWMETGAELAEKTMNRAYHLCRTLRADEKTASLAGEALMIAKDVHEVKKDYALVMRGISAALEEESVRSGMELSEIFRLLARSTEHFAKDSRKQVSVSFDCALRLRTQRQYELLSIFRNLLNNAVEAAPEDRAVRVRVSARQENGAVLFQVEDDCGGIPPQRLSQIFEPGFSSKINPQTGEINRGLGLPIVKDLTEQALGGEVSVHSESGRTTFTVRIPKDLLEGETDADLSH